MSMSAPTGKPPITSRSNAYYGYGRGKGTIKTIYPTGSNVQLGYLELIYRWGRNLNGK